MGSSTRMSAGRDDCKELGGGCAWTGVIVSYSGVGPSSSVRASATSSSLIGRCERVLVVRRTLEPASSSADEVESTEDRERDESPSDEACNVTGE